ncbi:MAG: ATP-binding protein [Deltaproteobacteria bacterium]|nr:ATP-binding protein [Deltaproteobacteria bacterium]
MVPRLVKPLKSTSFFLFGARGTGKTHFLRRFLDPETTLSINLLEASEFEELSLNPDSLISRVRAAKQPLDFVFIDEVQKIPQLLDVVHHLIESQQIKFALSGSSARKLRRGGANLLAGRAFQYYLFPLTQMELQERFSLEEALNFGTLPQLLQYTQHEEKEQYLRTYVDTYLKEEILVEQLVRDLVPFRKFLDVAAQSSGKIINYSAIARDIGSTDQTVKSYFQILEDTLLGRFIEPYHRSIRKRQRGNPKFYFFDIGVKRAVTKMLTVPLRPGTYMYGEAFEHFIIQEINARHQYLKPDYELFYLKSADHAEIDLIIDRPGLPSILLEIKSTDRITEHDLRHLYSLGKDLPNAQSLCLSRDPHPKEIIGIRCLPWQQALDEIGW